MGKKIFEPILSENISNTLKDIDVQGQDNQKTPNRIKQNKKIHAQDGLEVQQVGLEVLLSVAEREKDQK